jgi:SMI1/KNR4 family protein SUKH-1
MIPRQKLVEDFERKLGKPLPDDYRRFLLAGPMPRWRDEESPENPFTYLLHSFYDLEPDEDVRDLFEWLSHRDADLPNWFLGIGDQWGITIGLGISGTQRGRVYSWSWDDGEETEMSPSFDEFLAWARTREAEWKPGNLG